MSVPPKVPIIRLRLDQLRAWCSDNLESDEYQFKGDAETADLSFSELCVDSRLIDQGMLFVSLPGMASDGRDFVLKAVEQGAAAVLSEWPLEAQLSSWGDDLNIPQVWVKNLSTHLPNLLKDKYQDLWQAMLPLIAVTGTNGKTSVTQIAVSALTHLGIAAGSIGTLGVGMEQSLEPVNNTTLHLVDNYQSLNKLCAKEARQVCLEASSIGLEQGRLSGLPIDVAVFTNLTQDHLDYHKDMAQYAKAKSILAQWPHLKYAIINADDPELKLMFNTEAKAISFGMSSNDLHLSFENVLHLQEGMSASLCVYQDFGPKPVALKEALRFEFKTPLKGAYNLYNFLAVAAILRCRSISWSRIVEALSKPISIPGRLEEVLTERKDVPKCFVDFAHTPDALEAVLENMHQWKKTAGLQGRLVCVFGCGGGRDATKRTSMMEAALKWSDLVVVTADNPRNEALDNIMSDIFSADSLKKDPSLLNTKTMREDDRTKAIHAALSLLGAEDVCLIAGKGHETYQIIGSETYPYSDVTVVQEYFQDQ